jgi:cytochrome c-type biogenesis protein CcmH/NrfG
MVIGSEGWLRVLRPLGLLVLFIAVIRGLPEQAHLTAPEFECDVTAPAAPDRATLERCLDLQPDDVELMLDLGRELERAQEWDGAEALYRRALDVDPDDGDAHLRLGEILLRRGDAAGAGREGVAALRTLPGNRAAADLIRRAQSADPRPGAPSRGTGR